DAYDLFLGNYLPYTSGITSSLVFVDRRPLFVQAVPYLLSASIFLVLFSVVMADSRLTMKVFMLFWALVGAYCARFIYAHGMLYVSWGCHNTQMTKVGANLNMKVNWPKLNTQAWAVEGYNEALGKVKK